MSLSPLLTISIGPALPSWLSSKAALAWVDVPNTRIANDSDNYYIEPGKTVANFPYWVFVNQGLMESHGWALYGKNADGSIDDTSSIPAKNLWGFSGLTYWSATGDVLWAATGGGRKCWNANDITGCNVFAENPAITVRVVPSPWSILPPFNTLNPTPPSPGSSGISPYAYEWMLDNNSPISGHTYYATQIYPQRGKLLLLGVKQNWVTDDGYYKSVARWNLGASSWQPKYSEPQIDLSGGSAENDNFPRITDPLTEITYCVWTSDAVYARNPDTGAMTQLAGWAPRPTTLTNNGKQQLNTIRIGQGSVCFWRRSNGQRGIFGFSGMASSAQSNQYSGWWCFEITGSDGNSGVHKPFVTVNSPVDWWSFPTAVPEATPMVFDPVDEVFYVWNNEVGKLYKATWDFSGTVLTFQEFNPATTYATPPTNGVGFGNAGNYGQRMFIDRNCLIFWHVNTRNPCKIIRLR